MSSWFPVPLSVSVLQCCKTEAYSAISLVQHYWYREPCQCGSAPITMGVTSYYMITVYLTTANPLNSGCILTTRTSNVLMDVQVSCAEDAIQTSASQLVLPCTNTYLTLLIPFALAGLMLVLLLIICNLTDSMGTINCLIFYANIVWVNNATLV